MQYDVFLNKWLGKAIDWDGVYGPQCVDEIAEYCQENGRPIAYANAKDWANNPALTNPANGFIWVQNNPSDFNQVPKRGDIIVWNGSLPGSGGYGHIAIFDMVVRAGVFQSLDQNWGGQYVHFIPNHTWDYIAGWLTPKEIPAPAPPPPPPPPPPPAPTPIPAPDPHPDPAPENPIPLPTPEPGTPPPQPTPPVAKPPTPKPAPKPAPKPTPPPLSATQWGRWNFLYRLLRALRLL